MAYDFIQKETANVISRQKSQDDFYFQRALDALGELKEISEEDLGLVQEYFKNPKKGICETFREHYPELSDKFGKFIAYCDMQAQGSDSKGNSYYPMDENGNIDKRCIAKALIWQNAWIANLVQYLINFRKGKDLDRNVSYGVARALKYFENPKEVFPILSKSHIDLIKKKYLGDCTEEMFDKKLLEYCKANIIEYDADKVNDVNLTYFYSVIIYGNRSEWEGVDIEFYIKSHNVILTGAPGTGKTYLAKKVAAAIIGCGLEELDQYDESGERLIKSYEFVQFHPSYDYTDFVEGLRPYNTGTTVGFKYHSGTFRTFCEKALNDSEYNYVLVIDEINRGEISKIFGELFFSIDPGYRGTKGSVTTQYANVVEESTNVKKFQKGRFYVPDNVYIIGTMNDIDRSVESMDFAFRRRFAFVEITAKDSQGRILKGNPEMQHQNIDLNLVIRVMDAINKKLDDLGLNSSYHIGAAYFCKLKEYKNQTKSMWESLWKYHLKGVLYEYFRGEPDADKKLEVIYEAYKNVATNEQATQTSR